MQLHSTGALQARCQEIDCDSPHATAELTRLHDRSVLHGEVLAAVLAAVRHGLAVSDGGDALRAAQWARRLSVCPAHGGEPVFSHFVTGEHFH